MTQKPDAYEDFRDWPDDDEIFFDDDDFLIDVDDDPFWERRRRPLGQEMMPCAQKPSADGSSSCALAVD